MVSAKLPMHELRVIEPASAMTRATDRYHFFIGLYSLLVVNILKIENI